MYAFTHIRFTKAQPPFISTSLDEAEGKQMQHQGGVFYNQLILYDV